MDTRAARTGIQSYGAGPWCIEGMVTGTVADGGMEEGKYVTESDQVFSCSEGIY